MFFVIRELIFRCGQHTQSCMAREGSSCLVMISCSAHTGAVVQQLSMEWNYANHVTNIAH
jgi:hypothetical protein